MADLPDVVEDFKQAHYWAERISWWLDRTAFMVEHDLDVEVGIKSTRECLRRVGERLRWLEDDLELKEKQDG